MRNNRKHITEITYNGISYSTPSEIKEGTVYFYSHQFQKLNFKRSKMGLDGYNQLGTEKAFWLERDASMEEVIVGQEAEMMNLNFLKVSSNSLEISIIF
jgi:hypothetical protein